MQLRRLDNYTTGDELGPTMYLGLFDTISSADSDPYNKIGYGPVGVGAEFQYSDSLTAVNNYRKYKIEVDKVHNKIQEGKIEKEIQDSIYKCKHTYK